VTVQAKLCYLGFLQEAAARAARTTARFFLLRTLLTVLILALLLEFADAKDEVKFPFLDVTVDHWGLLVGACVLAFVVTVFDVAYFSRAHVLAVRALKLYGELGYKEPREEWVTPTSPFGLEYARAPVADPAFARTTYARLAIVAYAVAGAVLVGAQFFVLVELLDEFGTRAGNIAFALVPTLTALIAIVRVFVYRNKPVLGLEGSWRKRPTGSEKDPSADEAGRVNRVSSAPKV
jgi:hypothetical protein